MTVDDFKSKGAIAWDGFDNPFFQQQVFSKFSKADQSEILRLRNTFFGDCSTEADNVESQGGYEQHLEETRKKQEEFIEKRGASFVFYHSFIDALEDLDDGTFRKCIMALCEYAFYLHNHGLPPEDVEYTGTVKMYMSQAKPQLETNARKRHNGRKGGRPSGSDDPKI